MKIAMKILGKCKDQFFEELIEFMIFKKYPTYIILLSPN